MKNIEPISFVKLTERPDLKKQMQVLELEAYPAFFEGQSSYYKAMERLGEAASDLKLAAIGNNGQLLAGAEAVALTWNGIDEDLPEGYDAALQRAITVHESGIQADTICLVNLMVSEAARGRRLTVKLMQAFWNTEAGFKPRALIGNIRGALKHEHPTTPMSDYIAWTNDDGKPYDPWIRSFLDAGARLGPVVNETLTITSTLENWSKWTGVEFPENGDYIIPMGSAPLKVNCERDEGIYVEPGVWIIME